MPADETSTTLATGTTPQQRSTSSPRPPPLLPVASFDSFDTLIEDRDDSDSDADCRNQSHHHAPFRIAGFRSKRRRLLRSPRASSSSSSFQIPTPAFFSPVSSCLASIFYCFRLPRIPLPKTNTGKMFLIVSVLLLGSFFHWFWKSEAAMNAPWVPDPGANLFAQRPLLPPKLETFLSDDSQGFALPLRTKGRDVVDQNGRRFKLSSVNWYGASDELFIPGGLDVQHRSVIADTIRGLGFNSVRLPYADEMVTLNPPIMPHLLLANPDLVGLRALDVYEAVVTTLTDAGIAVIINNHITSAQWCCGADPCDAGWANDHLGPLCRVRQTEDQWIEHWETVMSRFVDNPRVIGADLRNEVRGVWGTMPWDKWASAAERAGNALLKMNPDWLIVVGGTESNNMLDGVAARPVVLDVPDRVVYSAHVYAWSGWGSVEGRYSKRSYPSFVRSMRRNWAYLVEGNEAPVWIGEFGAPHHPSQGDANYWQNLMRYLKSIDADFGYWAINPRKPHDDAKEGYSLVEDDWITPVLDYRMRDMVQLMRA